MATFESSTFKSETRNEPERTEICSSAEAKKSPVETGLQQTCVNFQITS